MRNTLVFLYSEFDENIDITQISMLNIKVTRQLAKPIDQKQEEAAGIIKHNKMMYR